MNDEGKTTAQACFTGRGGKRSRSGEQLCSSEESHTAAQRLSAIGNFVVQLLTGKCFGSTALHEILGIDLDFEHTVDAWRGLAHPEDRALLDEAIAGLLAGQRSTLNVEFRILRPDNGAVRWIRCLASPEFEGGEKITLVRGTMQDITAYRQREEELLQNKDLLQLFIEHAPAALAMFDREMRYLAASRRWREKNSTDSESSLFGRRYYDVFPALSRKIKDAHRRGLAGETVCCERDCIDLPQGGHCWVRWEVRPWKDCDGEIGGIVIFSEDISEMVRDHDRLAMFAQVFSSIREGILITDAENCVVEVNDAFLEITGYSREEVIGRQPKFLNSGRQSDEFYEQMFCELKERGCWSGEMWSRRKDGSIFAESLNISALRDAVGAPMRYIGLLTDVTRQKENERKLQHVAHYDMLTGMPNRALLADRLHQAMAQAQRSGHPLAVAYLDLDGFKIVNDTHGHAAGDRLLTEVASRMKRALREGDTLARLGGDEFVSVLLDLDGTDDCNGILRRLLAAAAEPVEVDDALLHVSASVGVAFYPQTEDVDADMLLRQADQAMYHAKLSGRNCFHFFDHSLDRHILGHQEDIERIRQALRDNEFELFYQPWVNMRTGELRGVEALIRWRHPLRGLLPPAMFLPVIEEHPLSIELGQWVLETAFGQLEGWNAAGYRFRLGVNVGAMQLQGPDFPGKLAAALARHPGMQPAQVEIEILETSALEDVVQVSQVIDACREIGVTFAIDDFGTGYSSLTYLRRLPARTLKIDQSFVRGILDDADDLTIIEGVLGLANAFHRQVVAEGVETIAHGRVLLHLGCELAQGYGIAYPMPADALPAWIAAWRPDPTWLVAPVFPEEDRPLLYATVDHQAWIQGTEALLKGERRSAPAVSLDQCRFHQWLLKHGSGREGMRIIERIDCDLHRVAEEIVDLYEAGNSREALGKLKEMRQLVNAFFDELKDLRHAQ